jgi:hypothetical protein
MNASVLHQHDARDGQKEGVMPKEMVFGTALPYSKVSSAKSVIGVHWGIEQEYVQVSASLFNDDMKYATGDGVVRVADGDDKVARDLWARGFYVDLDRGGINRLIRNLRRARDQAFGRDE